MTITPKRLYRLACLWGCDELIIGDGFRGDDGVRLYYTYHSIANVVRKATKSGKRTEIYVIDSVAMEQDGYSFRYENNGDYFTTEIVPNQKRYIIKKVDVYGLRDLKREFPEGIGVANDTRGT